MYFYLMKNKDIIIIFNNNIFFCFLNVKYLKKLFFKVSERRQYKLRAIE